MLNIIFCLVLEPLQWLTVFYLRMSSLPLRLRRQFHWRTAPWTALVSEEHSPVTVVLQYYSWMSAGCSPRLRLLFGRAYPDFTAWSAGEPLLLSALRNGISVAASWVFERSDEPMLQPPWIWARFVDHRCSDEKLNETVDLFDNLPRERIDGDFTSKARAMLRAAGLSACAFLKSFWRRVI